MLYVSYLGSVEWLAPTSTMVAASATALSRLQHPVPIGEHLSQVLLGLNIAWDIPAGFLIESLRVRSNAKLMLVHHLVVVLLAYITLAPPRFQYYVVFFFGLVEASSAPLALMDLCHPRNAAWAALSKTNGAVGAANSAARVLFACTYLLTRAVYFPFVMCRGVLPDLIELLALPDPPVSRVSLCLVLASAVWLTGLQLYWAGLILQQARGVSPLKRQ